ncbi:MAG: hypothetical protein HN578_04505 [Rhodospirillales bacterium]|jgi:hypothetical protein|nr:hypothetical protein [Rhodospirillales bacterium]
MSGGILNCADKEYKDCVDGEPANNGQDVPTYINQFVLNRTRTLFPLGKLLVVALIMTYR